MDHLRADLFLGLTDGSYAGLTDEEILVLVAAEREAAGDGEPGADAPSAEEASAESSSADPPPAATRARGGLELRATLSTLLGLDARPAELAGWGAIHAELARELAGAFAPGQWRYVLTDEAGYLLEVGLLTARPSGAGYLRGCGRSADVVEVAVRLVDLPGLTQWCAAGGQPGWAGVLGELAGHAARRADQPGGGDPFAADATRRVPGAALRRHLHARDRRCRGVDCRVPARRTDADHTIDYARSGPTSWVNLGLFCRHDHRLTHEGR